MADAPKPKLAPIKGRVLNARPDTIDFRDKMYSATLFEVPESIPLEQYRRREIPILDQGQEGACTGFGLATVIHYLLTVRRNSPIMAQAQVSPRMLYEMAKKYDEWEGEDYVGSSARGAIKGWHKHGVCLLDKWRYDPNCPDKELTAERAENAAELPLGAYLRVNHKDFTAMHAAMAEVGILYATATVHDGWYNVQTDGTIPYDRNPILGGHAFAVVGYDRHGFWIQNSWGNDWGKEGFARISYDDWAVNATDVWVTRLGAPVMFRNPSTTTGSITLAASVNDQLSYKELRPHVISLDNNGKLKETGTYGNKENDVKRIFTEYIPEITKDWNKKRILFYAHGGLVSEGSILERLTDYRETLLEKEIFPIFFIWHSDISSTIKGLLQDAIRKRQPDEKMGGALDFLLDRLDYSLEPLLRGPGKLMWDEMKQNAKMASDVDKGAYFTIQCLKEFLDTNDAEIHLVGHSAGGIFFAPFIPRLLERGIEIQSCPLGAPACTMSDFTTFYEPAIESGKIEDFTLFTLTDRAEQKDNCALLYNKSLLYLVSNSFETIFGGTPLLGMEKFIRDNDDIQALIDRKRIKWITSPNNLPVPDFCEARHHGDFDNDSACFNSTVQRILGITIPVVHVEEVARVARAATVLPPKQISKAALASDKLSDGDSIPKNASTLVLITEQDLKMINKEELAHRRNIINSEFKL